MKRFAILVIATAIAATSYAGPKKSKATIEIENRSDWSIHEIYLSPSDVREWGPDQLGPDETIEPGDSLTLTDIDCDDYDIRLVDEDGDVCIIVQESLCADDKIWQITNKELLNCQAETD